MANAAALSVELPPSPDREEGKGRDKWDRTDGGFPVRGYDRIASIDEKETRSLVGRKACDQQEASCLHPAKEFLANTKPWHCLGGSWRSSSGVSEGDGVPPSEAQRRR